MAENKTPTKQELESFDMLFSLTTQTSALLDALLCNDNHTSLKASSVSSVLWLASSQLARIENELDWLVGQG